MPEEVQIVCPAPFRIIQALKAKIKDNAFGGDLIDSLSWMLGGRQVDLVVEPW